MTTKQSEYYYKRNEELDLRDGYDLYKNALLVPLSLIAEIDREDKRLQALRAEISEKSQAEESQEKERKKAEKIKLSAEINDLEIGETVDIDIDTIRSYRFPAPPPFGVPCVKIYDRRAVLRRYKNISSIASDSDERKQIKARLDLVRASGDRRLLVTISDNWRAELDQLEENHQNFSHVIDYMRAAYATAELHDRVARPGNILLDGPPGCGKTFFSKKLAEFMGVKFRSISMESMQASFELLGVSDGYRNSKTGILYDYLVSCTHANQLILLDEVCKIAGDDRYSPLSALYRLLEKETAKTFNDLSENYLKLDYSHAFFVCTSNNYENIDYALRSRLRRFQIEMPDDATAIIWNIFGALKAEMPGPFGFMQLSDCALKVLMQQSPRRIKQLLEDGLGSALYDRRNDVLARDIKVEKIKSSIGF